MKKISLSVRTPRGRRFVVKLSSARHRLLRRAATLRGQTLSAFIVNAMNEVLEDLRQLSAELRARVYEAHSSVQSGLGEVQAALSEIRESQQVPTRVDVMEGTTAGEGTEFYAQGLALLRR